MRGRHISNMREICVGEGGRRERNLSKGLGECLLDYISIKITFYH